MKYIQCILPKWSMTMPWVRGITRILGPGFKLSFSNVPDFSKNPDALLFLWCDSETVRIVNTTETRIPTVVFLRRYEFFAGSWQDINLKRVDHLVFVNKEFMDALEDLPVKKSLIYNIFDSDLWKFKQRKHGKQIAMVGNINPRKNVPLAVQILVKLPQDYELHIVGEVQDQETMTYLSNLTKSMRRMVYLHEKIPAEHVNVWLEDKNYVLSCATSEGNPNSVIEAMAKGIKTLVHNWPGANDQFPPELVFNTVDEAVRQILPESGYDSEGYRAWVDQRYSLQNLEQLKGIFEELLCQKTT